MDEETGGGGLMGTRIMGLPVIVWVGIVGIGVYLYLRHSSSASAGSPSTSGGGGSITTGNTRIQKGAVTIDVKGGNVQGQDQPQPPTPHKRRPTHHVTRSQREERKETPAQQRREKHRKGTR